MNLIRFIICATAFLAIESNRLFSYIKFKIMGADQSTPVGIGYHSTAKQVGYRHRIFSIFVRHNQYVTCLLRNLQGH